MKNFRKIGRVDSENKKVLGPMFWALMMVPSDHSKYRKITRFGSEDNTCKVVGQRWSKIPHFGANKRFFEVFLIVTFVYL